MVITWGGWLWRGAIDWLDYGAMCIEHSLIYNNESLISDAISHVRRKLQSTCKYYHNTPGVWVYFGEETIATNITRLLLLFAQQLKLR